MRFLKFTAIISTVASLHVVFALLIITTSPAQASQQGRIYKDQSGAVFIYGLQPGETIETGKDFAPARFITSNACGVLIIKPSKTQPVGRVRVEGQTINSSTLPTQLLPSCKNGQLAEVRSASQLPQGSQPFRTEQAMPLSHLHRVAVNLNARS